jgi:transcriptional regulator with XRE-family HTH domain
MENTPLAAKTLAGTLEMHGWTQSDLAEKSGIHRPTVSLHITGSRPMRDDHLAAYIAVLDKYEQSQLVSAWLQDTLPSAALENILDSTTQRLREEVRTWSPDITPQQQSMLHYWADKIAADPELAEIFHSLSRKAGWHPSSLNLAHPLRPLPLPPHLPRPPHRSRTRLRTLSSCRRRPS